MPNFSFQAEQQDNLGGEINTGNEAWIDEKEAICIGKESGKHGLHLQKQDVIFIRGGVKIEIRKYF